ncbi:hypothetical protein [Streptomyces sp. MBT53]|uniref:hypothetical protein n=1 Tax=Streptomyces sp. MBT53 TaxID=1488384 RepID=UPI0035AC2758
MLQFRRASAGANAHCRRRREHGDWHAAAERSLFNRMNSGLCHCLQKLEHFDEQSAFPTPSLVVAA